MRAHLPTSMRHGAAARFAKTSNTPGQVATSPTHPPFGVTRIVPYTPYTMYVLTGHRSSPATIHRWMGGVAKEKVRTGRIRLAHGGDPLGAELSDTRLKTSRQNQVEKGE